MLIATVCTLHTITQYCITTKMFRSFLMSIQVVSTCGSEFITSYDVVVDSMDDDSSSNVLHTSSYPSLLLTDLQPSSSYTIKVRSVRDSTGSLLHYDSTCKIGSAISSFSAIYNLTLPSPGTIICRSCMYTYHNQSNKFVWQCRIV